MVAITNIRYRDIAQDEGAERDRLKARLDQLSKIAGKSRGLTPDEEKEKARIAAVLEALEKGNSELCERLFVGVRDLFNASPGLLGGFLNNHVNGVLRGAIAKGGTGSFGPAASCKAALTMGLLIIDDALANAPVVITRSSAGASDADGNTSTKAADAADKRASPGPERRQIIADTSGPKWAALSRMFFAAIGEAQSMSSLAMLVLPLLAIEGDPHGSADNSPGTVDAVEFARVMRQLTTAGVTDEEPQLRRRINEALNLIQNRTSDGSSVELGIDLKTLPSSASFRTMFA
jgi:hypothetical protein